MANRLTDRVRHSNPHLEFLPTERLGRFKRGLSLEPSLSVNDETINRFRDEHLAEAISAMTKESEKLRLENLLFSRYLQRIYSSKMLETFEEYADESDDILPERQISSDQTTLSAKLPEIARRLSVKRSSVNSSQTKPSWSKLVNNWREYMNAAFLLRVDQEKVSIAAYEIEQTKLDWDRMATNAHLALDQLDDKLRSAISDVVAEENFNSDLEKNINKFRGQTGEAKFFRTRSNLPAEHFITRINQRIQSRINTIRLLHMDTAQVQFRIRTIDAAANAMDEFREKTDELDINFVRTRKIDYLDTYKKFDRKYKLEKSSQYPLLYRLQELKKLLSEKEQEIADYEYKYKLLENRLEKFNNEIDWIQYENDLILNENQLLRNRIADIKTAPTITEYAHIIEETKELQHGIDIWTKRVNIAETVLSQLKRQTKSPNVLPPLKSIVAHPHQSAVPSSENAILGRG